MRPNLRPAIFATLAVLLTLPAGADVRLEDLAPRLAAEQGAEEILPGTGIEDPRPRDLLGSLRGPDGAALPCATPVSLSVLQAAGSAAALPERLRFRLSAPPLAGAEARTGSDGAFVVRYTTASRSPDGVDMTDADGDGSPDAVTRILAVAAMARETLVERLGWIDPVASTPFSIVLARLGGPDAWLLPVGEDRAILVLDPDVAGDPARLREAVAHQLAHASQWRATRLADAWWYEASAAWVGLQVGGDLTRLDPYLHDRAAHPELALASSGVAASLGAVRFALFLEERAGARALGESWKRLGEDPRLDVPAALDEQLRRVDGRGLRENVRLYHLWNLATGARDTGRHYRNGSLLPLSEVEPLLGNLPESGTERLRAPRGLGANILGVHVPLLPPAEREGGVRLSFEGEVGIDWAVDAVGVMSDGSLEHIPFRLSRGIRGELVVPAQRYETVLLVVQNLDPDAASSGGYSWEAAHEPGYPYRLESLRAEAGRGQVVLHWSTVSESELFGWRVMSAASPEGPWSQATTILLPAVGVEEGIQSYSWVDGSTVGGVRRWYRVEGVTIHGVPVSAGEVSVLPPPGLTSRDRLDRLGFNR